LRALDWRGARLETDLTRKAPGVVGNVSRAIVGQPFGGLRQAVDPAKPVFNCGDHEVANVLAFDAFGGGDKAHGFPVAAIQRERDPDLLAIVAAQFKAIRAPPQIGAVDRDPPVVPPFLSTTGMSLQKKTVSFHDAIDALVVGRLQAFCLGGAPQDRPERVSLKEHLRLAYLDGEQDGPRSYAAIA
jgi:hypothetical protein